MKKMVFYVKQCFFVLAACLMWGLFFPDFALTPDTCKVIYEDGEGVALEEWIGEEIGGSEMFYRLLQAEPEDIRIKSRLAETFEAFWKRIRNDEKCSG